ncbi:(Fe-S)-binding protein [Metallumcola ferriviriculae]|uniref:Glycolate oxidase iron-sulfur subunit n=1 Tax=Metallumcola ferriviriculae TaxID=3039180 RepID=A0AAU0ULF8_9FIRM|nr:(Fe-S)-binding protein [Desulfitibacteraceae bacterium MK1]
MALQQVPAVKDLLRKCVRCGKCRSVCPIFKEIKNEGAAPRAHVFLTQLMRDGELGATADVAERASRCLLCKSCSKECPSGIPVDQMVVAMRHHLHDLNNDTTKKLMLNHMFKDRKALGRARFLLQSYQSTGIKSLVQKTGVLGLVSKDLDKANKLIAPVSGTMASKNIPETAPAKGKRKIRVGYFLGCATNMFYPKRARDTVEVLTANNCEVFTPSDLHCCGMPHIANGDAESAAAMTRHNFKIFFDAGVDVIISDCASCSSMLQGDYYDQLFQELPEEIAHFKGKIYDLNKFLIDHVDLNNDLGQLPAVKVTYHDPCHLVKSQGVTKEPRQLLNMVPGVELVEMVGADQCCGGAGTFSMGHYDLSRKILDRKIQAIEDTGAEILTTSCPACSMQLGHGLNEHAMPLTVKHPVEFLAEAYRQAKRSTKIS